MEYRRENNGWLTFHEHWGWVIMGIFIALGVTLPEWIGKLSDTIQWLWLATSFGLMIFGGGLIMYAKMPVYRRGRFFTFGPKSVPVTLIGCYRWGWWIFGGGVLGAVLLICSTTWM